MSSKIPEIEEVLAKNKFSDRYLKELKSVINSKYQDTDIRKEVISTIHHYLRNYGIDFNSYFKSSFKKEKNIISSNKAGRKQKGKPSLRLRKKRPNDKNASKISGKNKHLKVGSFRNQSLPTQFPQIDWFFEKKSFSEDELKLLKETVEKEYRNEQMRKAALSLIALHLVKYKIQSTIPSLLEASKKVRPTFKTEKNKSSKAKQNPSLNTPILEVDVDQILSELKGKCITDISNEVDIPKSLIFFELEKKGIKKRGLSKLSIQEFGIIKNLIIRKLNGAKIIGPKKIPAGKTVKRHFGKGKKNYDGVFGKIQKYGGAGKVIYTRM